MAANSNSDALPLAVTMGDPSGIGPDIILMSWLKRRELSLHSFFVMGCPDIFQQRAKSLGLDVPVSVIASANEASATFDASLPVIALDNCTDVEAGKPNASAAASVIQAIDRAVELVRSGRAGAVVTAPISKKQLSSAGFPHPGHTEYLAELCADPGAVTPTPVMMLAAGTLRVVPVTIHIPLSDVPRQLTSEKIVETVAITHADLIARFGISAPRIGVTGLNPHAGEDGMLGSEEIDIIEPAIDRLRQQEINVEGPLPADALFQERSRTRFDAIVAMYHDQALIPVKTLAFDEGVNVTLGLPIVRTSPDHGTAYDLAGTGKANPGSMIAALKLAVALADTKELAAAT